VGAMLTLVVRRQWVRYKLDESIEQPCSDFLAHTSEVCKGIPSVQWVSGYQGCDSLGTCMIFAECKTVITAVLMVMSSMDPHMISGT
jgi:hypothetical protein